MKKRYISMILILLLVVVSCAPGVNDLVKTPDASGDLAGFWKGLWHGAIVFFTFIGSLFNNEINIYEVHNAGPLYNLGYLIGVLAFAGGSGGSAGRRSRKKRDRY
ncbi:MAG: hypothetical protein OCD02_18405 [Spirochaetaceae bacterium]